MNYVPYLRHNLIPGVQSGKKFIDVFTAFLVGLLARHQALSDALLVGQEVAIVLLVRAQLGWVHFLSLSGAPKLATHLNGGN